jgi:hypothetical protein
MGKPVRKLSVKKETFRQLSALTEEQLQRVAGGTIVVNTGFCNDTWICAGILTGGGGTLVTCKTCQPNSFYCF